jgi:DNA-binding transcriptional ArsR family regulator
MSVATATPPVSSANDPKLRKVASLLKLGSEAVRAQILMALRDGGLGPAELSDETGIDTATIAHHARLLRVSGVIASDRIGGRMVHSLTTKGQALLGAIDVLGRE